MPGAPDSHFGDQNPDFWFLIYNPKSGSKSNRCGPNGTDCKQAARERCLEVKSQPKHRTCIKNVVFEEAIPTSYAHKAVGVPAHFQLENYFDASSWRRSRFSWD